MHIRAETTVPEAGTSNEADDDSGSVPAGHAVHSRVGPPSVLDDAHGAVWPTILAVGVGAVVLVLPLLGIIAGSGGMFDPAPMTRSWWPLTLFGLMGTAALVDGLRRLIRLFTLAARASAERHGLTTFAAVATDSTGDARALLYGDGRFSGLASYERAWLLRTRIAAALAYLLAALWLPLGFAVLVRLAADGRVSAAGIGFGTLGPAVVLTLVGLVARVFDRTLVRAAARRDDRPTTDGRARGRAAPDDGPGSAADVDGTLGPGPVLRPGALRVGAVTAGLTGTLVLAQLLGIVMVSIAGPIVGGVTVPSYVDRQLRRMAAVEPLRENRLGADSTISPEAAGAAINSLGFVGRPDRAARLASFERPPARTYDRPWFPEDDTAVDLPLGRFAADLFPLVARRALEPAETAFLERVASHPAHREFTLAARAPGLDLLGSRYHFPLPDTLAGIDLPIRQMSGVRVGANARLAVAALALERGRTEAAERAVREVVSVGFLLMDHAPTTVDAMLGRHLVGLGGTALESLYDVTGRDAEARAVDRALRAAERIVARSRADGNRERDVDLALDLAAATVDDSDLPPAIRWGLFGWFNTVGPCLDARRVVFGPGDGYDEWMEEARERLATSPAATDFYEFMRHGDLTAASGRVTDGGWSAAALPLLVGGERLGACGRLVRGMIAL